MGVHPILVTLPPFKGAFSSNGKAAWDQEKELIRQEVNQWLIVQPNVINLDQYVRSDDDPQWLAKQFDSGDHMHFSESDDGLIGDFVFSALKKYLKKQVHPPLWE